MIYEYFYGSTKSGIIFFNHSRPKIKMFENRRLPVGWFVFKEQTRTESLLQITVVCWQRRAAHLSSLYIPALSHSLGHSVLQGSHTVHTLWQS